MPKRFTLYFTQYDWFLFESQQVIDELACQSHLRAALDAIGYLAAYNYPGCGAFSFQDNNLDERNNEQILNHPLIKPIADAVFFKNKKG